MAAHRHADHQKKFLIVVITVIFVSLGIWFWVEDKGKENKLNPYPVPRHNITKSDDPHIPPSTKPMPDIGFAPHEWQHVLNILQWPGPAQMVKDLSKSTAHSNTYFYITELQKNHLVGEELHVTVVARDFKRKPKQYGGDFFQAKLFSPKLKASVFGEVTDLQNGSYSVRFLLPWEGEAWVAVRLIHSSEAVQVLKHQRQYNSDRVYFRGTFVGTGPNGTQLTEVMECNAKWDRAGLERMQKGKCCCEYPDPRTGEVWLCKRPQHLPCDTLVYHMMGRYRKRLDVFEAKLLDKSLTNKWIKGNNSKIIILPSNETVAATEKCRTGLQTPIPAGFFMKDVWISRVCAGDRFNTVRMTQCLKDRDIYMMGDSTMRQWFHYLRNAVPSIKFMNLHTAEQAGPFLAVDVANNIVLRWRAHGPPLRSRRSPFADLHYISNEIDSLAGGSHQVIVFNLWAHFTTFPLEYFARRVARIRQAVVALLKRAPRTTVIIKSANTSYKDVFGSDWLALQLDTILRVAFEGINVAFLDVWQMTSCHYSSENIHPNTIIVRNEIDLLLSFICPA